jgi:predicted nucleic acid-binding protein
MWEPRENVSTYDAMYVALAEAVKCPLVTADRGIAAARGIRCDLEVLDGA